VVIFSSQYTWHHSTKVAALPSVIQQWTQKTTLQSVIQVPEEEYMYIQEYVIMYGLWKMLIEVLVCHSYKIKWQYKWIWIISLKNNYLSTKSQITLMHLSHLGTVLYSLLRRVQILLYQKHFSSVPSACLYCTATLAMKTLNTSMMAHDTT
jgi:hypothetical protein